MRLIILTASFWVLVAAKPEMYKEKEDFQYSRSSSDDGTKSGYYGAQRGNMGGNYERAHNMDALAQHHMSTLVRNVDGELGEGANTRTGSVFSAANSRGLYGSGNYDLSYLKGRNFGEGLSLRDSHSSTSNSDYTGYNGYDGLYSASDAYNNARYSSSQSQSAGVSSGYHKSGLASQYLQTDAQQAVDNNYDASNYEHDRQAGSNYRYAQSTNVARSDYEKGSSASGYDYKTRNSLIHATPVRVYITPGTRVAIPVAAQVYDASAVQDENALNSDLDILSTSGKRQSYVPTNNAKHYESSYSYRKQWEKKNSIPVVTEIPTESPFSKNSELYENAQSSHTANNQYESELSSADSQSSSANSAYSSGYSANTKTALSSQARLKSQTYNSGASASNAYTHNAFNSGARASDAYTHNAYDAGVAAKLYGSHLSEGSANTNNLDVEDIATRPKSYHSSYAYHKSWERRGDPYVIKPVGGDVSEQASQRLTAASPNQGYVCTYCLDQSQQRVRRSINTDEYQQNENLYDGQKDIGQQSVSGWEQDLGQQTDGGWQNFADLGQQTQNKWDALESFNQQPQSQLGYLENLGQQTQNQWDKLEDLGQQTQNQWGQLEDLSQQSQTQDKLEDLSQQTQDHWSKLQNSGQQSQDTLEVFGQQTQNQWGQLEDLSQQLQSQDKLEDLGQQTQSHWGQLEDLGQQTQSNLGQLEDLSQQTQPHGGKLEDLGQQTQNQWGKLEDLSQQSQSQWNKLEDLSQQSQTQDKLEDLGQQTQSHWGQLEDLSQQTQPHVGKLEDMGQQIQNQWGKLEDLSQQFQTQDKLEDLSQQTQSHWGKLEDLGQHTQSHWDKLEDLGQQTQSHWDGQQTQHKWDDLDIKENSGQQGHQRNVANFGEEIHLTDNNYGGYQFYKPWSIDGRFVPYTYYSKIPELPYAQESQENINKRWNYHNFEHGSYIHHHNFDFKESRATTHNSDFSFNINQIDHSMIANENSAENSKDKLLPKSDTNLQRATTMNSVTIDNNTPKSWKIDEAQEKNSTPHPMEAGRGDIGPEDKSLEISDKTPEEIESLSLIKDQRIALIEPLKLSVTGLNQQNEPEDKQTLWKDLSTVIEPVTYSTTKATQNIEYNNINSTPKTTFLSSSNNLGLNDSKKEQRENPISEYPQHEKPIEILENFEKQNWVQQTQSFDQQNIGQHLEPFEEEHVRATEQKYMAQDLQPFKELYVEQHLEPFEGQTMGHLGPLVEENVAQFQQQNLGQQIQNFDQQNIENLAPTEQKNLGQELEDLGKENFKQLEIGENKELQNFEQNAQFDIPEKQILGHYSHHKLEQQLKQPTDEKIVQISQTSTKHLQEHNNKLSKNHNDLVAPVESATEKSGFWSSVWNKTKKAKDSVVSWFNS